jgi:hypothetical protein
MSFFEKGENIKICGYCSAKEGKHKPNCLFAEFMEEDVQCARCERHLAIGEMFFFVNKYFVCERCADGMSAVELIEMMNGKKEERGNEKNIYFKQIPKYFK